MAVKAGYQQTEVGVIPQEWEVKFLREVAQIRSGIAKNINVAVTNPIRVHYLRVANVQDGFLDLSEMNQIEISRGDLQRYAVLPGDVLMNEGGDLDKLGRGAIWQGEFNPCVHQNHVFVVRCGSTVDSTYVNIWSAGSVARRYFLVAGKQTTNLASINKTALGKLPVAVPPLAEQQAIAEALSDVDGLISALDALIAKQRAIKQGAMQELLTGQRRLPGFAGEWEVNQLENVSALSSGTTPSRELGERYYHNGTINWVKTTDLNNSDIVETSEKITTLAVEETNLRIYDVGTVLVAMYGGFNQIGRTGILKIPAAVNQALTAIRADSKVLNPVFLINYLNFQVGYWKAVAMSSRKDPNITRSDIKTFPIALPSLAEQTAIAQILADMDDAIAALVQKRAKTVALKQGMMQALLTGQVRLV
jgi:type I restriction enzyme S subunit